MNNDNGTITLTLAVDGQGNVTGAVNDVSQSVGRMASETRSASGRMASDIDNIGASFGRMVGAFTAGNLITAAIEKTIGLFDKLQTKVDASARYAARVETLGTAMHVTGNNAGYTATQMDGYEKSVKQMGITTEASRESLARMASSEIALAESSRLARVAQDAAVIGNINSSEAFGRMIHGIRSGEVEILRNIGISVQFEQGYKKMASQLGKTTDQLTEQEKIQSRVNQVLAEGAKMQGAYEAAMGTTGKQLTSLPRYLDELELAFGRAFAPALGVLIEETTNKLKGLLKHFEENRGAYNELARNIADIVKAAAHPIDSFVKFVNSPFNGPVSERTEIEEQNRINTEAANKQLAEAKERQRIRLGEESRAAARAAAQAETDRIAREKAEKAAEAWRKAEADLNSELVRLNPALTQHEKALDQINNKYDDLIKQYPQHAAELLDLKQKTIDMTATNEAYKYELESVKEMERLRAEGAKAAAQEYLDYTQEIHDNMDKLRKDADAYARLSLDNQLAEINAQEKFYKLTAGEAAEKRIELLQQALDLDLAAYKNAEGNILAQEEFRKSIIAGNTALLEQQKILADSTAMGGAIAGLQEYSRAATDIGAQTKNLVTDFAKGMEDALVRFVQTGKLQFRSLIDSMLANIARMSIQQGITGPISQWISNSMTGSGSGSGNWLSSLFGSVDGSSPGTSGVGGAISAIGNSSLYNNAASWAGSIYNSAAGWASGLLGSTSYAGLYGAVGNSAMTGILANSSAVGLGANAAGTATGGAMGSGGSAAGSAGGMSYGPWIAGAIYTYNWLSDYFGHGGAWNQKTDEQKGQIAFGNTFGAGAPMWLDYLTKGGLFGTDWRPSGGGLQLGITNGQIEGMNYTDYTRKKNWWRGSESRPKLSAIDPLLQEFLESRYASVVKGLDQGGKTFGVDATAGLADFNSAAQRVSLTGASAEEASKRLEGYFRSVTNEALVKLYPDIGSYKKLGEDASDTFNRLEVALRSVNDFAKAMGMTFADLSLAAGDSADMLIEFMGGINAFQSKISAYVSVMFTQDQQRDIAITKATATVNTAFSEMGIAVPATKAAFNELVKSLMLGTETGNAMFSALMDVAPAFATLQDAITETSLIELDNLNKVRDERLAGLNNELGMAISIAQAWGNARNSLSDAALKLGQVGLSPEASLASLRGQFAGAVSRYQGGDVTAVDQITALASQLQVSSRDYFGSSAGFWSETAAIQDTLDSLALFSTTQITAAEVQSASIQAQISQLTTVNDSIVKLTEIQRLGNAELIARLRALETQLANIESKTELAASAPLSVAA